MQLSIVEVQRGRENQSGEIGSHIPGAIQSNRTHAQTNWYSEVRTIERFSILNSNAFLLDSKVQLCGFEHI